MARSRKPGARPLAGPQKRSPDSVSAAVRARPRPCFGPGVIPLAPFPLVPINTPWGSSVEDIQNLRVVIFLFLEVVVIFVSFFF